MQRKIGEIGKSGVKNIIGESVKYLSLDFGRLYVLSRSYWWLGCCGSTRCPWSTTRPTGSSPWSRTGILTSSSLPGIYQQSICQLKLINIKDAPDSDLAGYLAAGYPVARCPANNSPDGVINSPSSSTPGI